MSGDRSRREAGFGAGPSVGGPGVPEPLQQDFDGGSLYVLRSAVSAHAAAAGMAPDRVYDVVVAAHELAANAVRHGAGHGRLRLWAADGILACQITDNGSASADGNENAGAEHDAPWPVEHGHGLWVVGQIAEKFTIDRGPAGTTATATFALRPPQ